ncbi:HAD hydrolase family protein [Candidatus Daviesbacteria bacterium]|nr:HAD hydrolase family protein [Candidatus Daviesbacteria bacterium]
MVINPSSLLKDLNKNNLKSKVIQSDKFGRAFLALNRITQTGKVEQHDQASDITFILQGEAKLEKDGEIEDKTLRSLHEWQGTKIKNGRYLAVKKGDLLIIEPGSPHRFIITRSSQLVYLTFKKYLSDYIEIEKLDPNLIEKIKKIEGIIMDVDGTMTDGKVLVNDQGEEFASFSRIDSLALLPWQGMGKKVGVISREEISIASARAKKLKINCVQNIKDKLQAAEKMIKAWKLSWDQVCFIGDDVNDISLLQKVGFSTCPKDAQPQVLEVVDLVLPKKRGDSVIRELLDLIFLVQLGKYPEVYEREKS